MSIIDIHYLEHQDKNKIISIAFKNLNAIGKKDGIILLGKKKEQIKVMFECFFLNNIFLS
jgi:hypothetical protein